MASRCVPEEIKKLIRSVLLSVVGGIAVSDVPRQYELITNEKLNWSRLGYRNLIELLRDIPDVARIAEDKVYGITTDDMFLNATAKKAQFNPDREEQIQPRNKSGKKNLQLKKKGKGRICYNCSQSGHMCQDCPMKAQDTRVTGKVMSCLKCHRTGHILANCPETKEENGAGGDSKRARRSAKLQPNLLGYYAICIPRKNGMDREDIMEKFEVFGDIKDSAFLAKFIFIRYAEKSQALDALERYQEEMKITIPVERNNPHRVIKEKDVNGELPAYPKPKVTSERLLSTLKDDQLDIFIGNIPADATEYEFKQFIQGQDYISYRLKTRLADEKQFAFLLVEKDKAEDIVTALQGKTIKNCTIPVQISYNNVTPRNKKEDSLMLESLPKSSRQSAGQKSWKHNSSSGSASGSTKGVFAEIPQPLMSLPQSQQPSSLKSQPQPQPQQQSLMSKFVFPNQQQQQQQQQQDVDEEYDDMPPLDPIPGANNDDDSDSESSMPELDPIDDEVEDYDDMPPLDPLEPEEMNNMGAAAAQQNGGAQGYTQGPNRQGPPNRNAAMANGQGQGRQGAQSYGQGQSRQGPMVNGQGPLNRNGATVNGQGPNRNGAMGNGQGPNRNGAMGNGPSRNRAMLNNGQGPNRNGARQKYPKKLSPNYGDAAYSTGAVAVAGAESNVSPQKQLCRASSSGSSEGGLSGGRGGGQQEQELCVQELEEALTDILPPPAAGPKAHKNPYACKVMDFPINTTFRDLLDEFRPFGVNFITMINNRYQRTLAYVHFSDYEAYVNFYTKVDEAVLHGETIRVYLAPQKNNEIDAHTNLVLKPDQLAKTNLSVCVDRTGSRHIQAPQQDQLQMQLPQQQQQMQLPQQQQQMQLPQQQIQYPQQQQQQQQQMQYPQQQQQQQRQYQQQQRQRQYPQQQQRQQQQMQTSQQQQQQQPIPLLSIPPLLPPQQHQQSKQNGTTTKSPPNHNQVPQEQQQQQQHPARTPQAAAAASLSQDPNLQVLADCCPGIKPLCVADLPGVVNVIVTLIKDETHFWGQIFSQDYIDLKALSVIQQRMNDASTDLLFPFTAENASTKRAACTYDGEWSRVWLAESDGLNAKVLFVDWGNFETVKMSDLRMTDPAVWSLRPMATSFRYIGKESVDLSSFLNQSTTVTLSSINKPNTVSMSVDSIKPLVIQ